MFLIFQGILLLGKTWVNYNSETKSDLGSDVLETF